MAFAVRMSLLMVFGLFGADGLAEFQVYHYESEGVKLQGTIEVETFPGRLIYWLQRRKPDSPKIFI